MATFKEVMLAFIVAMVALCKHYVRANCHDCINNIASRNLLVDCGVQRVDCGIHRSDKRHDVLGPDEESA